jgi:hypothetical protein
LARQKLWLGCVCAKISDARLDGEDIFNLKRQIIWRLPYCGGADIHGTPSCFYDEEKDEWKCE